MTIQQDCTAVFNQQKLKYLVKFCHDNSADCTARALFSVLTKTELFCQMLPQQFSRLYCRFQLTNPKYLV